MPDNTPTGIVQSSSTPRRSRRMLSTRLENTAEFRLVRGLRCPDCRAPIQAHDAESLSGRAARLVCVNGHDILEYGL